MDGKGDAPFEWLVSRVCEEFPALSPRQAVQELMDDRDGLILDAMEFRAYARTKDQMDRAKNDKDAPTGPMADWVFIVQRELLRRKRLGR